MWLNTSGQAASGLTQRHIYSSVLGRPHISCSLLIFGGTFTTISAQREAIIQLKLFVTCQKPSREIWRGVYSQFFNAPLGALRCFWVEQSPTPLTNNRDEENPPYKRTYYSNARIFKSDVLDVFFW